MIYPDFIKVLILFFTSIYIREIFRRMLVKKIYRLLTSKLVSRFTQLY
jgi:hypothetical protein